MKLAGCFNGTKTIICQMIKAFYRVMTPLWWHSCAINSNKYFSGSVFGCICTCNSWCGYIRWWWLTSSVCMRWWLILWRAVEFSLCKSFHHSIVLCVALSTAALLLWGFCHHIIIAAVVTEDTATQPARNTEKRNSKYLTKTMHD